MGRELGRGQGMSDPAPKTSPGSTGLQDLKAQTTGAKVGRAMQCVGAGLLVLSLAMFVAWAVRLFGGTKASRDNATLGVITFGIWALVGSVFLGAGTAVRRSNGGR
jgi:hypothetical protein